MNFCYRIDGYSSKAVIISKNSEYFSYAELLEGADALKSH